MLSRVLFKSVSILRASSRGAQQAGYLQDTPRLDWIYPVHDRERVPCCTSYLVLSLNLSFNFLGIVMKLLLPRTMHAGIGENTTDFTILDQSFPYLFPSCYFAHIY